MQVKHIVAAVAAALVAPAAMAASLSATNVIYISGASAQTPALAKSMTSFCNNAVNTYVDDQDGKQAFVYSCSSVNAASGLTGSLIVVKSDAGGSANGVDPVVNKGNIKFPDITNCATGTVSSYNTSNVDGTPVGTCAYSTAGVNKVPALGLTDVPSAVWQARGQFTPSTTNYTAVSGFAGQGFGVAVSDALYTALQNDQITAGSLASSCAGSTAAGPCQPSISKEQYAAIVTNNPGDIYQQNWTALLSHTTSGAALTAKVNLCRRGATSGTQASTDAYFLNTPCNAFTALGGALSPIGAGYYDATGAATTSGASNLAFIVTEASSTGNVKTCLTGTTYPYSIGVMSLENAQPSSGWKWVKMNGVSPNLDQYQKKNTVDGSYDFAYETEMLYRNDAASAAQTLANSLVAKLGDGSNLSTFYGLYADPSSGATYVAGETHRGTRFNNICQPHQLLINQ